jgi:hypothetical protein
MDGRWLADILGDGAADHVSVRLVKGSLVRDSVLYSVEIQVSASVV